MLNKLIIILIIPFILAGCRIDPTSFATGAVKELNRQYDYANGNLVAECVERDDYIVCYEK